MKLSEHFSLEEMELSATATAREIDNTAGEAERENMRNLCQKVLEPLREWYGQPILVTSGYRCEKLNREVGGQAKSQHMKGEAADIVPLHYMTIAERNAILNEWFEWIQDNLPFDQLIMERETRDSLTFWIHVSLCRDNKKNRKKVISSLVKSDLLTPVGMA